MAVKGGAQGEIVWVDVVGVAVLGGQGETMWVEVFGGGQGETIWVEVSEGGRVRLFGWKF